MEQAFIGLGSNLGGRVGHLRGAVRGLGDHSEIRVVRVSPVYETEPHTRGGAPQPRYLNAAAEVATTLSPEALLAHCHRLERAAGRRREEGDVWAPRTLDLDLLVYGAEARQREGLRLPHPRLGERRFVLQPLADLAPNLYVPAPFSATVAELLARCPDPDTPVRTPHRLLEG